MEFYTISQFGYQKQDIASLPADGKWVVIDDEILIANDQISKRVPVIHELGVLRQVNGVITDIHTTTDIVVIVVMAQSNAGTPLFYRLIYENGSYVLLHGDYRTTAIIEDMTPNQMTFINTETNAITNIIQGDDGEYVENIYDDVAVTKHDTILVRDDYICFVDDILDEFICKGPAPNYDTEQPKLGKVGNKKVHVCGLNANYIFAAVGETLIKMPTYGGIPSALRVDGTEFDFIDCVKSRVLFGLNGEDMLIWKTFFVKDFLDVDINAFRRSNNNAFGVRDGDELVVSHYDDFYRASTPMTRDDYFISSPNIMGLYNGDVLELFNETLKGFDIFHNVEWVKTHESHDIIAYKTVNGGISFYNSPDQDIISNHLSSKVLNDVAVGKNGFMLQLSGKGDAPIERQLASITYRDSPSDAIVFFMSTFVCVICISLLGFIKFKM